MLTKLKLQTMLARLETDISPTDLNDGRASDIRPNSPSRATPTGG